MRFSNLPRKVSRILVLTVYGLSMLTVANVYPLILINQVNILYWHSPDPAETPISESLSAMNQLYKEGKFKHVSDVSTFDSPVGAIIAGL